MNIVGDRQQWHRAQGGRIDRTQDIGGLPRLTERDAQGGGLGQFPAGLAGDHAADRHTGQLFHQIRHYPTGIQRRPTAHDTDAV